MSVYRPKYRDPKTGEKKTAAVWWYHFTFAGRRIQESSKSTRKTVAVEMEKNRRRELERALAGMPVEDPTKRIQTVTDALKAYEKAYKTGHRPKSVLWVEQRSAHVERLLAGVMLPDLTEDRVRGYMATRQSEGASNRTVNMELSCLARAMGRTWRELWPKVKKLEENSDVGRALENDEEKALLDAAIGSRSRLIYPFLMALNWTGMRSDEARTLQWSQIAFEANQTTVGRSKTDAGKGRQIPMSAALRMALEQHAGWYARKLGPIEPEWYVFPLSNRIKPVDPKQPATSLKRAWEGVREKTKIACRLHDFRHTFCTKLAEAGVPESTMLDMMGHVSAAMLRRYSHIRAQARREAIAAIEARSVGDAKESAKVEQIESPKAAVTH